METRKTIDTRAFGLMVILCMIWAVQQIAIKAAAADIAPIMQIGLRSGIGALLVWALMLWRSEPLNLQDGTWRPGLLVGVLFALEFLFVGEGLRYTNASHMAVFLYTAPFFAAIGLHLKLPEERLRVPQWLGIAVAFSGIVIAFFGPAEPPNTPQSPNILLGDFFALLAGALWGATTVVIRCSSLSSTSPTKTLLYQLLGAFVILVAIALVMGQTQFRPTTLAISSLAFQALVVAFASFLAWFWLLRTYLASRLGVFSFMTPMFGIVFGVWLLDEPLDASFVIGAVLVVAGIILVSGDAWLRQCFDTFRRGKTRQGS